MNDRTAHTSNFRYLRPGWFNRTLFDPLIAWLTRRGVSVMGTRELRVVGRTSGVVRSTVVNLLEVEGQKYLVSPRGHTQWVRNLRVAGAGELRVGRGVERVRGGGGCRCREAADRPGLPRPMGMGGRPVLRGSGPPCHGRRGAHRGARLPGVCARRASFVAGQRSVPALDRCRRDVRGPASTRPARSVARETRPPGRARRWGSRASTRNAAVRPQAGSLRRCLFRTCRRARPARR